MLLSIHLTWINCQNDLFRYNGYPLHTLQGASINVEIGTFYSGHQGQVLQDIRVSDIRVRS